VRSRIRSLSAVASFLLFGALLVGAAEQSKRQPPAQPLDLNTATIAELQQLPGIGPTTAKAIVQFREKSGPFRRVEDLLAVRRITKRRLETLRPYVTVQSVPPRKTDRK
jgi:competence protein ComEA